MFKKSNQNKIHLMLRERERKKNIISLFSRKNQISIKQNYNKKNKYLKI